MGTGVSQHPQPSRKVGEERALRRNTFESELWDDLAGIIYYAENQADDLLNGGATRDVTLIVPAIVLCRFEIHIWSDLRQSTSGASNLQMELWIDGVQQPGRGIIALNLASTIEADTNYHTVYDATPGFHTLINRVHNYGPTQGSVNGQNITVRRGRQPPA